MNFWGSLCYAQTQTDCATVSLELFYACELHYCSAHVLETLSCQVGAGDVLDV